MKIIQRGLKLEAPLYYMKHLQIIAVFLDKDFKQKEIEVLANFMSLDGSLGQDRFGTTARKVVRKALNLSPGGLGNYLKAFSEKGFITKDEAGNYQIAKYLCPDERSQGYQFKLIRTKNQKQSL